MTRKSWIRCQRDSADKLVAEPSPRHVGVLIQQRWPPEYERKPAKCLCGKANPVYAARHQHLTARETNKLTAPRAQAVIAAAVLRHLHAVITRSATSTCTSRRSH